LERKSQNDFTSFGGGNHFRRGLPIRYQYLAVDAFDRALITEGQFARFLRVDRLEARQIAELLRPYSQDMADGTIIDIDVTQPLGA
jgi:hypothetical protein